MCLWAPLTICFLFSTWSSFVRSAKPRLYSCYFSIFFHFCFYFFQVMSIPRCSRNRCVRPLLLDAIFEWLVSPRKHVHNPWEEQQCAEAQHTTHTQAPIMHLSSSRVTRRRVKNASSSSSLPPSSAPKRTNPVVIPVQLLYTLRPKVHGTDVPLLYFSPISFFSFLKAPKHDYMLCHFTQFWWTPVRLVFFFLYLERGNSFLF